MEFEIETGCVFMLLLINGILDWKKREVSLTSLLLFGLGGIGLWLWRDRGDFAALAGGVGVGVFFLVISLLTREAVGFGDGLLLCVTGIYLGFWENLYLLTGGLLLCAGTMGSLLLLRKKERKDRAPLVPFLLFAMLVRLVL